MTGWPVSTAETVPEMCLRIVDQLQMISLAMGTMPLIWSPLGILQGETLEVLFETIGEFNCLDQLLRLDMLAIRPGVLVPGRAGAVCGSAALACHLSGLWI